YSIGTISFDQTLDISRARSLLGYEPQISVADGLRQYARSLKG
ncbi:MAG: NAD(P)-dependent oxidoreductase, partial [Neisseria sp.]|nr:NAD(P)-dependent oxidoreductase [Neisseria sp.]